MSDGKDHKSNPAKRRSLESSLRRIPSLSNLNRHWNVDRQSAERARQQAAYRANLHDNQDGAQQQLLAEQQNQDQQLRQQQAWEAQQQVLLEEQRREQEEQHRLQQQQQQANMMTTQSFAEYMDQDRQLRAQETNTWVGQMRSDQKQNDKYHHERLDLELRQIERQEEEAEYRLAIDIAATIPPCNGDTEKAVRDWLKEVEMSRPYTDQTILVACRSSRTPLRREIETFLGDKLSRQQKTWAQLKAHIIESFLDPEEEERQRTEVESMTQGAYETTAAYGRRFREAAEIAYPTYQNAPRIDSENRMLWRYYIKGLRNAVTAEKITAQGGAQLFEEAIKQVAKLEAKKQRVTIARQGGWIKDNSERREEPMDVNNLEATSADTNVDLQANVRALERKMCGMSSHLTRVTSAVETMAAKLSLNDTPVTRGPDTCTDDRYGTRDDDMTRPPSPYFQRRQGYDQRSRQQYQPRDCYVPASQYDSREPPLNATPNTGFYNFVPDQPRYNQSYNQGRQPKHRNVRFERTPEGAPVCAHCSKIGHLAKDCRSRKQNRMSSNNQARRPNQGGR